jgi:hypothetical protein
MQECPKDCPRYDPEEFRFPDRILSREWKATSTKFLAAVKRISHPVQGMNNPLSPLYAKLVQKLIEQDPEIVRIYEEGCRYARIPFVVYDIYYL